MLASKVPRSSPDKTLAEDNGDSKDPSGFIFKPAENWSLISQGAEARIWKIPNFQTHLEQLNIYKRKKNSSSNNGCHQQEKDGREEKKTKEKEDKAASFDVRQHVTVIAKERFSKSYRHPILDERLTKQRCRAEARILEKCRKKGSVAVPEVVRVDPPVLYLEFLEDCFSVREFLQQHSSQTNVLLDLAQVIGRTVGNLHDLGIVHGDLTTSNMMIKKQQNSCLEQENDTDVTAINKNNIFLIDFGLAKNASSAEERAVDLYVLQRALQATHPNLPEPEFWDALAESYCNCCSKSSTDCLEDGHHEDKKKKAKKAGQQQSWQQAVMGRFEQVRMRGRKRECFG